jgi:hypothetical protein
MTNSINETGLVLETLADIVAGLELGFKTIYGDDINVAANSPDGQMINLFAQAKIDMLDLISNIYNSFSPTSAIGSTLDQRCAINGVIRKAATRTTVYVTITTDRAVALVGLDTVGGIPFTVSDGTGNKFNLITGLTTVIGANTLLFSAEQAGAIEVTQNTITNIDSITLGVLTANNFNEATIKGVDEETDSQLRFRRSKSVSNPSSGYLDGLSGALLALEEVVFAQVYENNTDVTDVYGITPHSIWCVVDGGIAADIANTIYERRNAGCGMYNGTGATGTTGPAKVVAIEQVNGFYIPIKYSEAIHYDLYIRLIVTSRKSSHSIDATLLKNGIYANIDYGINEIADYSEISSYVKSLDPLAVITDGGVGATGAAADPFLAPPTIDGRWIISTDNIEITVV